MIPFQKNLVSNCGRFSANNTLATLRSDYYWFITSKLTRQEIIYTNYRTHWLDQVC